MILSFLRMSREIFYRHVEGSGEGVGRAESQKQNAMRRVNKFSKEKGVSPMAMHMDRVCGMWIDMEQAQFTSWYKGEK
ncbi:MAG: hypothetical protein D6704_08615 [Nitrospirae bacterium]|nr:MAG: hypothetical protein D6704_08615 [Nitrospirota bacterium]